MARHRAKRIYLSNTAETHTSRNRGGVSRTKKKTALVNKYLKTLARECRIATRLTTHVARHSWAAFMDENNLPIQRIQQTLAHKDAKTTQVYLQNLRSGMFDEELIRVLNRT